VRGIAFDSRKLRAAASKASQVELDRAQDQLVRDISEVVAQRIGMDPLPCRGLWLRAIKQWQQQHELHADALSAMRPVQRLEAALEIKQHFLELAFEVLARPEQRRDLLEAVDEALDLYIRKYNKRPAPPG
jgi:hypothetical protein